MIRSIIRDETERSHAVALTMERRRIPLHRLSAARRKMWGVMFWSGPPPPLAMGTRCARRRRPLCARELESRARHRRLMKEAWFSCPIVVRYVIAACDVGRVIEQQDDAWTLNDRGWLVCELKEVVTVVRAQQWTAIRLACDKTRRARSHRRASARSIWVARCTWAQNVAALTNSAKPRGWGWFLRLSAAHES